MKIIIKNKIFNKIINKIFKKYNNVFKYYYF